MLGGYLGVCLPYKEVWVKVILRMSLLYTWLLLCDAELTTNIQHSRSCMISHGMSSNQFLQDYIVIEIRSVNGNLGKWYVCFLAFLLVRIGIK